MLLILLLAIMDPAVSKDAKNLCTNVASNECMCLQLERFRKMIFAARRLRRKWKKTSTKRMTTPNSTATRACRRQGPERDEELWLSASERDEKTRRCWPERDDSRKDETILYRRLKNFRPKRMQMEEEED